MPLVDAAHPWRRALWAGYGLLGVLLVGFAISRLLRPPGSYWTWLDGWSVDGFELTGAGLCLAKGLVARRGRVAVLSLGTALLAWGIGDTILTVQSLGGASAPTPSWPDVLYLLFYPLAYSAIALFVRAQRHRHSAPIWLDGLAAGLGAAAICAGFAFHRIVDLTGTGGLGTVVNLAYPIGDLLLLALVVGSTAVLGEARKLPWLLLSAGCALNVLGDTSNLLERSLGRSGGGSFFDAVAWPSSILLMSAAVWLRSTPPDPLALRRPTALLVPVVAATSGLVILVTGTLRPMNRTALILATATLLAAGSRLALSAYALRAVSEERHRQSFTDELTGLANRRFLFIGLREFFADYDDTDTPDRGLAFLFVDLNDFKEINDSFGHPSGDELLRQLGPRLAGSLRSSDLLVRFGGDEFAVVLIDGDTEYAIEVAQRLAASLREPFDLGDISVSISASIGIAVAPFHARDAAGLIRDADVAMYRAKAAGSEFAVYEEDLDTEGRLRSAGELRTAIERGHLVLHYQPQLDLRTGTIKGVEALVRWAHPRLGLLPPERFLSVAEDAGLMRSITNFVLEEALSQGAAWRRAGVAPVIAVNVSPTNLLEAGFTDLIRHLLKRHGLAPDALVLEITETCIISEFEKSRLVIEELRDLGLVVSIDDFGSGFTSLAHLGHLAVGELKLDRLFLAGLAAETRARNLELVRATIDLAHTMELRVVVEGIEDQATLDLVSDFGCEIVQGYFISRPLPADDVLGWLRSRELIATGTTLRTS
jgi:diguanylate cyclase (GGDEF)-like protein